MAEINIERHPVAELTDENIGLGGLKAAVI